MVMDLLVDSYKWLKLSEYAEEETNKMKYKQVSETLFNMFSSQIIIVFIFALLVATLNSARSNDI